MNVAAPDTTRSALRQSLEGLLGELFRESAAATGYTLDTIAYGDAVEVALHKGEARFVVWLRPSSDATGSYKQTARFKIGYLDPPPDRAGFTVLEAVQARIQRWEDALPEHATAQLFDTRATVSPNLELLAVRAGLKPACRYLISPEAVAKLVRDVQAEGLHACVTEDAAFVGRFRTGFVAGETTVVHVGGTRQAAARAAELERSMMKGWRRWWRTVPIERALGAALGYPPCCTEAFLKVRTEANDTIRFHALARTPGTAAAVLNDVDDTQAIISHFVCRYDCAPSVRYADALLAELGRVSALAHDARRRRLHGLVARFRAGGALHLELGTASTGTRHDCVGIAAFGKSPALETWHHALRGAGGVEIHDGYVEVLRADRDRARLPAAPDQVQIRLFA